VVVGVGGGGGCVMGLSYGKGERICRVTTHANFWPVRLVPMQMGTHLQDCRNSNRVPEESSHC